MNAYICSVYHHLLLYTYLPLSANIRNKQLLYLSTSNITSSPALRIDVKCSIGTISQCQPGARLKPTIADTTRHDTTRQDRIAL